AASGVRHLLGHRREMPVQRRRRHLRIIFFHSGAWDEGRTARFLCQSNEEQSEVATSDYESKVLIGPELTRRKTSRLSIAFFISVAIIRLELLKIGRAHV